MLLSIFAIFVSLSGLGSGLFGQDSADDVQKALINGNYPWYDGTNDQLAPVDLPAEREAVSKDRNNISPYVSRTRSTTYSGGSRFTFSWLSVLSWIVIGLLIAVIVGLLVWAFFRMENQQQNRRGEPSATSTRSREDRIKELPFDFEKSNGDFRQQAYKAYEAGDYRTAMILLFSHVLLMLDKSNLIQLRKGKTNRQYLSELRPYSNLSNYYKSVMIPFEDVFFGDYELNRNAFDHCWKNLESFQRQIQQTSQVAG
jgi:hypothetical protein